MAECKRDKLKVLVCVDISAQSAWAFDCEFVYIVYSFVYKCVICFFAYSDNILYSGMSQTHAPFLSHLVTKPTKRHVRSAKTQVSLGTRSG